MSPPLRGRELAATAFACGVAVAGIYYAQPLLPVLTSGFHANAAAVVSAGQLGYAAGLLFLVPLGDRFRRERLARLLLWSAVPVALLATTATTLPVLISAVALLGVCGSAAQVLVAHVASAAGPERRGRAVGTVMGGLTAGILLARVVSGQLAALWGWRAVYAVGAGLLALAALLLRTVTRQHLRGARNCASNHPVQMALRVENHPHAGGLSRPAAEPHVGRAPRPRALQLLWEPRLIARCASGFAIFAAFSAFWTPTAYLLAAPPFRLGESAIGLFALTGLAGVLLAQPAGRWCDRGHARPACFGFGALMVVAFLPLALGRGNLVALGAGAVLLDLGLRGVQTSNQQRIYAQLPAGTHSRVTTVYMTCYFLGGATGSALSAAAWAHAGWTGVCLLGAALAALPLIPEAALRIRTRATPRPKEAS